MKDGYPQSKEIGLYDRKMLVVAAARLDSVLDETLEEYPDALTAEADEVASILGGGTVSSKSGIFLIDGLYTSIIVSEESNQLVGHEKSITVSVNGAPLELNDGSQTRVQTVYSMSFNMVDDEEQLEDASLYYNPIVQHKMPGDITWAEAGAESRLLNTQQFAEENALTSLFKMITRATDSDRRMNTEAYNEFLNLLNSASEDNKQY